MKNKTLKLSIIAALLVLSITAIVYATSFTSTYDTNTPLGSDDPAEADDRMREIKSAVQERENVDHYWPLTGTEVSDPDTGEHRKVTLRVGSAPTSVADKGFIYAKDVSAKAELFYRDEDGNEVQLTNVGEIFATPSGTIQMTGRTTAPAGWILCQGQEVSQTTYAALYAALGADAFGIDAGGNFFLPDMRGRVPVGVGTGDASDATAHDLAEKEGTEGVTLTSAQSGLPAHTHSASVQFKNPESSPNKFSGCKTTAGTGTANTNANSTANASEAHSSLQPSLTLNFIIKL